jgi:hypothetical protein
MPNREQMVNTQWQIYKELELVSGDELVNKPGYWHILWSFLKRCFLGDNRSTFYGFEIYKMSNSGASSQWYAYHPTLKQSIYLESTQDLQQWMEEQIVLHTNLEE